MINQPIHYSLVKDMLSKKKHVQEHVWILKPHFDALMTEKLGNGFILTIHCDENGPWVEGILPTPIQSNELIAYFGISYDLDAMMYLQAAIHDISRAMQDVSEFWEERCSSPTKP